MSTLTNLALLRRLNLNQLLGFLVVAETESFREATAHLHVSQPALSTQIHLLEDALGVPLFHRTSRSVSLTEEGRRLLPVARLLAREISLASSEFRDEAAESRGVATLLAIPTLPRGLIPAAMADLADAFPGIQVKLKVLNSSNEVAQRLRDGEADLGVLNALADLRGLVTCLLLQDDHMAVVPASEPTFSGRTEITLRELTAFPFLVQPRGTSVRDLLDARLQEQGLIIQIRQELLDAAGLVALAASGLGVAVLPASAMTMVKLEGVRFLRLLQESPRSVVLASAAGRSASPAANDLRTHLLRAARRLEPGA